MDKATSFRAFLILIAAIVLFAVIAMYRSSQTQSERFNTTLQPPYAEYVEKDDDYRTEPLYAQEQFNAATAYDQNTCGPLMQKKEAFSPTPRKVMKLAPPPAPSVMTAGTVLPSESLNNEKYRAVDFSTGNTTPSSVYPSKRLTTMELLPKDSVNTKWAQVTPSGQGELKDLNFMTAGWHIGVNTQGQSLRNPNLQLRSDPINPQLKVSPWNMSTVEPDVSRRPFEIA